MADLADTSVALRDYQGMVSRPDPNDIQPGAAVLQINLTCVAPGALSVRGGLRLIRFDED